LKCFYGSGEPNLEPFGKHLPQRQPSGSQGALVNDYNVIVGCNVTPKKASFWFLAGALRSFTLSKPFEAAKDSLGKIPVYNNGILFPRRKHFGFRGSVAAGGDAL
jgi:hypothetical protein